MHRMFFTAEEKPVPFHTLQDVTEWSSKQIFDGNRLALNQCRRVKDIEPYQPYKLPSAAFMTAYEFKLWVNMPYFGKLIIQAHITDSDIESGVTSEDILDLLDADYRRIYNTQANAFSSLFKEI